MTSTLLGFPVRIVDAFSFLSMVKDIFWRHIYHFKANSATPFIIDGGANIGLCVIYLKRLYPDSEILAFEPDSAIHQVLRENVEGFSHVSVIQAALWRANSTVEFMAEGSWAGRICQPGEKYTNSVPGVRLRDYLDRHVDFLKLDIEGAETEVLLDCAGRLYNVGQLFFEYHSFGGQKQELGRLLGLLTDSGFRYYLAAWPREHPLLCPISGEMDLQVNVFATSESHTSLTEIPRYSGPAA